MTEAITKQNHSQTRKQSLLLYENRDAERLTLALEAIKGGFFEHAVPLDHTTYHSESWAATLGYRSDELPSHENFKQWLYEQVHPDDREYFEKAYNDFVSARAATYDVEIRIRHKNGNWIWVRRFANALERAPNGLVRRVIGIMFDISDRKNVEDTLRQAVKTSEALNRVHETLHSTLDLDEVMQRIVSIGSALLGSESAAVSLRQDDHWVVTNVHGMPSKIVGTRMDDDQERHAVLALNSRQVIAVEDAFNDDRFNMEHLRNHGIRSVLVIPLIARNKAFGVIFFNYHTAQHEFKESELNFSRQIATIAGISLSNAKLFNEAKYSSQELSEYAHALTHNLKGPLRAIHNYVNFLFEDLADTLDGEPKRYLEGMRDAIIQSGAQFKDLETLYRVKKHPMDFEPFKIEDLLDEMQSVYKNNSAQELIVASNWPVFKGEKFLLRQVLFNLISNGFKFNRSEVKRVEVDWQSAKNNRIEIFVRDNGIGIEQLHQEQIFKIFKRLHADREFEGTGVGLAIVKRAVQRIGGELRVESTVGEGSTFYVNLPISILERWNN